MIDKMANKYSAINKSRRLNKRAFTLIELLVVIAVLALLVLLAVPRFMGYIDKAHEAQITNDIKVTETKVAEYLIDYDDLSEIGVKTEAEELEGQLYDKHGKTSTGELKYDGPFWELNKDYIGSETRSKLKGSFYSNKNGEVVYGELGNPGEQENSGEQEARWIPIWNEADLAKIGTGVPYKDDLYFTMDAKYIQMADIDLSATNWEPIGYYKTAIDKSSFKGTFDGNGLKITGLTINRPEQDNVGLFGYTEGATIKNVGPENVSVTGFAQVGGLVGRAYYSFTIENSYTTIENSYTTGEVAGQFYVGGLAGSAYDSTISNSYATVAVTGSGLGMYVGGLVGDVNRTTISNSYATGRVTGNQYVGGLVGNAYENSSVINSYWNTGPSGLRTSAKGTGKTTVQMKQEATYKDWDFGNIWQIDEGQSYPYLQSNPQSPAPGL